MTTNMKQRDIHHPTKGTLCFVLVVALTLSKVKLSIIDDRKETDEVN